MAEIRHQQKKEKKTGGLYRPLLDHDVFVTLLTGEKFVGKLTQESQYEVVLVNSGGTTLIPKHAIKLIQMKASF